MYNIIMKFVLHTYESRGKSDHGWLKSRFSFSFDQYRNPERMQFGLLRVLNDDWIVGGRGFGFHPHKNMEIISIPLSGKLEHKDSLGNELMIGVGDVQTMSAGSGVIHSEMNSDETLPAELLQIWIETRKKDILPAHSHKSFLMSEMKEKFCTLVEPENIRGTGLKIHQDAYILRGIFSKTKSVDYKIKKEGSGLYVFLISGKIITEGQVLETRDALGVWETETVKLEISEPAEILLIEVPMK